MRAKLLLGILLLGLLAGCATKPAQKPVPSSPSPAEVSVPEEPLTNEDAEIDALIQEVQELEEFLSDVEQGDTLELSNL